MVFGYMVIMVTFTVMDDILKLMVMIIIIMVTLTVMAMLMVTMVVFAVMAVMVISLCGGSVYKCFASDMVATLSILSAAAMFGRVADVLKPNH